MNNRRILLVEDNAADIRLTEEVLRDAGSGVALDVVRDGEQALAFLRRSGEFADAQRPDLVLLDLNLPRKDGRELLAELKADEDLALLPVIMLTTSRADHDIGQCYDLGANSYIAKPVDLDEFMAVLDAVQSFWLDVVRLPTPA